MGIERRPRIGKSRLWWALNKLLKGAGAGSDPTEIDVSANEEIYRDLTGAVQFLVAELGGNAAEVNQGGTTWVDKKSFDADLTGVKFLKLDFELRNPTETHGALARLRIDTDYSGQCSHNTSTYTWKTVNWDISQLGLSGTTTIWVQVKSSSGEPAYNRGADIHREARLTL